LVIVGEYRHIATVVAAIIDTILHHVEFVTAKSAKDRDRTDSAPTRRRRLVGASMAALAVVLAAACGTTTPDLADPFTVAGMRVTDGPSGLRSGAPKP
jgi:hypothetical protein